VLRVVKLGGSLLDLPDLGARLRAWLDQQESADTILVVGGGTLVEGLRRRQKTEGFTDRQAHWLAIRAMADQAEMLRSVLPEHEPLTDITLAHARRLDSNVRLWILDAHSFMRDTDSCQVTPLPESWEVTSDSIAARVAELCDADELVLLKSAQPPQGSLEELAAAGYVDRFFPQAAAKLRRVRFVDLRADQ
jgi:aspartokinase-like uncharacterized kinase